MWYEMKREFIEAAARVMWAHAWGNQREELVEDFRSGELLMDWPDQTAGEYVGKRGWPESMQGVELTEAAPPTPDYARLEAAILLRKLEQANGCGLAVIVEAAAKADCADMSDHRCGLPLDGDDNVDMAWTLKYVVTFASAVALEALGTVVSWTDDHEAFELPYGERMKFNAHNEGVTRVRTTQPFVVPSIEFTYEEGEE